MQTMADEEIVEDAGDINLEEVETENKVEKRIKDLSNKVKLTSKERDELAELNKNQEAELGIARKEVEFYSTFSNVTDKYPNAKEFKDQIKEKVKAGYSMEDAAVAVLAKEGKLNMAQKVDSPAGGSATNPPQTGEPKPLNELTREEKRAEVMKEIEKGNISLT